MIIIKKPIPTRAFVLGMNIEMEQELICRGLLTEIGNGLWRLKTRETLDEGELVKTGDYVKLDSAGMPYPVAKDYFEINHELLREGWYLQKATLRKAWSAAQPMCPEIRFLLDQELLSWKNGTFSAFLWGTMQNAAEDAVIVFNSVTRAPDGTLTGVDFHFVAADEFGKTYDILTE